MVCQALWRPWRRETQPCHHRAQGGEVRAGRQPGDSLAGCVPTLMRARWGAGYGTPHHLPRAARLGPPVMVVAEIPVFVFPSLLLQCNHPQGMYLQVQEGTFTEFLVCARTAGDTQRPMSQCRCRSVRAGAGGGWVGWDGVGHGSRSIPGLPCTCPHRGCRESTGTGQGVPRRASWSPPCVRTMADWASSQESLLWEQADRGSLEPLQKGLLRALIGCSRTARIKGTTGLFVRVLTLHELRME